MASSGQKAETIRRVLEAVRQGEEVTTGELLRETGLPVLDLIASARHLVESGHLDVREERRADLIVLSYRRR